MELTELPLCNNIDDHKQNWESKHETTCQQTDQISTNCHLTTKTVICRDNG